MVVAVIAGGAPQVLQHVRVAQSDKARLERMAAAGLQANEAECPMTPAPGVYSLELRGTDIRLVQVTYNTVAGLGGGGGVWVCFLHCERKSWCFFFLFVSPQTKEHPPCSDKYPPLSLSPEIVGS